MKQLIMDYLIEKYDPHTAIVYGSFSADRSNEFSDFDVLLITDKLPTQHDGSIIEGVELDAFIYSEEDFNKMKEISKFIQVHDGEILLDKKGIGRRLVDDVKMYAKEQSFVSNQEKIHLKVWCHKMLLRTQRGDAEGMFRWHWLLHDSLEIYCNMRDMFYFGPNKTLTWIQENDEEGYMLINEALRTTNRVSLKKWIERVVLDDKKQPPAI